MVDLMFLTGQITRNDFFCKPSATIYRTGAIISRGLYIFYPIFTEVYIVERLVLQTIYVLKQEILQFFGLKSAVYN